MRWLVVCVGALASAVGATIVTDDAALASDKTFDFVIAGAGLSGLTVANKLSRQGHSVLVIEAGPDGSWNPAVFSAQDRPYPPVFCNWAYPRHDDAGNKLDSTIDAGACIGGSTSINGMVWIRPTKAEVDQLEALGNPGWNWESLEPHMAAIERNMPPTKAQIAQGAGLDPDVHGHDGQVNTSFPTPMRIPKAVQLYKDSLPLVFSGLQVGNDLSNRTSVVSASTSWTMWYDPATGKHVRSSAADALLWAPGEQRSALTVLANHTVAKVTFDEDLKATGVVFVSTLTKNQGPVYAVKARRSVILAAGTLATPPILERSGLGDSRILAAAKIEQLVDLPGVGANLNDKPGVETRALMPKKLHNDTSLVGGPSVFGPEISLVNINEIWATKPVAEIVAETYPTVFSAISWPSLPLSRGHVHVKSASPFEFPVIVPRFLADQFDQQVAVAVARMSRAVWTTKPFQGYVEDAYYNPKIGPNGTDTDYLEWLKRTGGGASHWVGTTAMMPRHLGGVVDSRLRVYGTRNLRVVDAGVLPIQSTAHIMSILYGVAQRAAGLILEDCP
ncbi:GMC oxidoreductase [Metarhizium album ARSEF 1941]|uniref:GMC oxidoreductase n=1 Tax=Metarhizium album (strain ARSEF 1941) TaxID=1081103 RepID=A0A0B2WI54_METAS|nr:GMC oxidoreductase [Metarhizium album ARSEF 1941]KHN95701.1 GMC oxidoreductase [Metarhizium album ARSEF 1941]